jgi:hypothetical protein
MNDTSSHAGYMLLFRGPDWDRGLSREATQALLDRAIEWFGSVNARGLVKGAAVLDKVGRVVVHRDGAVADGPFVESKEVIGGYLTLDVETIEEATAIARACPTLSHGITVEIRPLLTECPIAKRLRESESLVTA